MFLYIEYKNLKEFFLATKHLFYLESGDKPTLDPITYYFSVKELDETPPYKINNKIAYNIKVLSKFIF